MKDIVIKKLTPQFTTVLTTLDVYEDDLIIDGMLALPKGSLKIYQKVLAVGANVRNIKPGDMVLLNFQNYEVKQYKDNSLKNNIANMQETDYTIEYNFPKLIIDGQLVGKFQDRDVEGVIEEYEMVECETPAENTLL